MRSSAGISANVARASGRLLLPRPPRPPPPPPPPPSSTPRETTVMMRGVGARGPRAPLLKQLRRHAAHEGWKWRGQGPVRFARDRFTVEFWTQRGVVYIILSRLVDADRHTQAR